MRSFADVRALAERRLFPRPHRAAATSCAVVMRRPGSPPPPHRDARIPPSSRL